MWLTAIRDHGYLGKRIKTGQHYEVHSPTDAKVLQAAKLARPRKIKVEEKPYLPAVNKEQAKTVFETAKSIPVRDMQAVADTRVESNYDTRDEAPEEEKDEELTEESVEEDDTISPEEKGKQRKRRRQYKRKDMLPE